MIHGSGSQFPRNNSHTILQLKHQNTNDFGANTAGSAPGLTITQVTSGAPENTLSNTDHAAPLAGLGKYLNIWGGAYGVGQRFDVTYNTKLRIGYKPFTLFFWMQALAAGENPIGWYHYIFHNNRYVDNYNGNYFWGLANDRTPPIILGYSCDGQTNIEYLSAIGVSSITDGFHHYAICRESLGTNKTHTFYDGKLVQNYTVAKYLHNNEANLNLYADPTNGFYSRGKLSNVTMIIGESLWNRSFTPPVRQA
jgi:hypothetical protein